MATDLYALLDEGGHPVFDEGEQYTVTSPVRMLKDTVAAFNS
jgi:hypothetical protein